MLPPRLFHFRGKLIAIVIMLLALLLVSLNSQANQSKPQPRQDNVRQEQVRAKLSASQAADRVQRQYGGKVMGVQTRQSNGTVIYSVKILQPSGHMRTVNVNGNTGAFVN